MTARIGLAIVAAVAGVIAPLTIAMPAHAAQGNLEVSPDGVTYSKSFSGALFSDLDFLVPGDMQDKWLYLRNSGDAPGFLRVILEDVRYDDLYFANALTVQATANGIAGPQTPISLAQPCWVLTEGQHVGPGQVVALNTQMVLGALDGQNGMGATAALSMAVTLSDTTPGSLSPTECGQPDISLPIIPIRGDGGAQFSGPQDEAAGPAAEAGPPAGALPVLNLPGGIVIDPNTWDLWEEFFVLTLVLAFLAGSVWFVLGARKRRNDSAENPEGAV